MSTVLPTMHAPAERATPAEVKRQAALFSERLMFGELLEHVPDMILILNSQRQAVFANAAVLEFGGFADVEHVIGRRPGEIFGCKHSSETPGGCGTTLFCRYCGAVNGIRQSLGGRPATEECRITTVGDEGEEAIDLRVWTRPLPIGDEQFIFYAVVNIAEEKRRQFLERIFLHDVMNTAGALRGFSALLKTGMIDEPDVREQYMDRMHVLSERIVEEIQAHQQLVAAENGELQAELQKLDSLAILQGLYASYDRTDMLNGRKIALAPAARSVAFESDAVLLRRVVGNMIKNAIEASVPGETVTLDCLEGAAEVVFSVHNPTYMPENIRLQVFNRSFSTKGAGRGLGTYSMKFLTEHILDGHIGFTTSEQEGTTFRATYPIRRSREQR
jgi:signal transduction histidine kinase